MMQLYPTNFNLQKYFFITELLQIIIFNEQQKQNPKIPEEFKAKESLQLTFPITEKFESLNGSIFLFYTILKILNIEGIVMKEYSEIIGQIKDILD